mmetsp:Transcript_10544/g.39213  ORF Transcript_10544/g.39213 Transcript_10544/m.39213 type:complete len:494 (-) Transcript_10544:3774-5255(-)
MFQPTRTTHKQMPTPDSPQTPLHKQRKDPPLLIDQDLDSSTESSALLPSGAEVLHNTTSSATASPQGSRGKKKRRKMRSDHDSPPKRRSSSHSSTTSLTDESLAAANTVFYPSLITTALSDEASFLYSKETLRSHYTRSRGTSNVSTSSEYGDPTNVMTGKSKFKSFPFLYKIQRASSICGNLYTPYFCITSCIFTILVGLYIDFEIIYSDSHSWWYHRLGSVWGNVILVCLMLMALLVYVVSFIFTIFAFSVKEYLVYYQYMKKFPFTRQYDWSFDAFFPFQLYLPHLWIPGFALVAFIKVVIVNNFFPLTTIPWTLIGVLASNAVTIIGLLAIPFLWWYLIADASRWHHILGWLAIKLHIGFTLISLFCQIYGILTALKADGIHFAETWTWTTNINLTLYIFCGLMFIFWVAAIVLAALKKNGGFLAAMVGMVGMWIVLLTPFVPAFVVFALNMDGLLKIPMSLVLIPVEVFHVIWIMLSCLFFCVVKVLG